MSVTIYHNPACSTSRKTLANGSEMRGKAMMTSAPPGKPNKSAMTSAAPGGKRGPRDT